MRGAAMVGLAVALGLGLGLGGCGGGRTTPAAAPSNSGSTAAALGGVTAVPGVSAGPLQLGMTEAAVRAAMGAPESASDGFLQYYRAGISVAISDGKVDALHVFRGVPGGYENEPWLEFDLQLPSGLTWTATEDQVIAALGTPTGTGDLSAAPIPSKWIDYSGVMFDFRIDDGRMFHVVISAP